jgi:hypothetical protein
LNINSKINNENQDYKIGTVGGTRRRRRVKKGDYGDDGIWLMDFTYMYETELINLLPFL